MCVYICQSPQHTFRQQQRTASSNYTEQLNANNVTCFVLLLQLLLLLYSLLSTHEPMKNKPRIHTENVQASGTKTKYYFLRVYNKLNGFVPSLLFSSIENCLPHFIARVMENKNKN